jgi:hypothetical protein
MHRAVLQACAPWFLCLVIAVGLAGLLVQFCGGRWQWRRLRDLHADQQGGVQSLSLVLTLPIFLMLVLFIVQISQMMVAVMMVHYAAFAAARAASVWIPSDVTVDPTFRDDFVKLQLGLNDEFLVADQLKGPPERANVIQGQVVRSKNRPDVLLLEEGAGDEALGAKFHKVALAATIPCLTISPSRDLNSGAQLPAGLNPTYDALLKLYPLMNPNARGNGRIPQRLKNKLAYSARFTRVSLEWLEVPHPGKDVDVSPSYNPRNHPLSGSLDGAAWNANEVGFRDPVTVHVTHSFALLPGIGRILKMGMVWRDGDWTNKNQDDSVASKISRQSQSRSDQLYTLDITASATFLNDGFKSLVRHAVQP